MLSNAEIAELRVHEPLIDERIDWEDDVEIPLSGIREVWSIVATKGKAPPHGYLDAGRVLLLAEGLGLHSDPLAGLVWTKEHGKKFIHQVWVDSSARRIGLADLLVEIYRRHVSSHVIFSGPFSPAGRALAESVGAKIVNDE